MSPDSRSRPSRAARNAAIAGVSVAVAWWLVLAVLQVAEGGFYSDDWGVGWSWWDGGYSAAVEGQFDVLGSKPLLAFAAARPPTPRSGSTRRGTTVLAATLTVATTIVFYFVLRALRFEPRDAVPIALLALLFPWASGVRLWPTGSINNLAILLLFAGLLVAIRGLRVPGRRGLLIHLGAAALYCGEHPRLREHHRRRALPLASLRLARRLAPRPSARRDGRLGGRRGGDLVLGAHPEVHRPLLRTRSATSPTSCATAPT